MDKRQTFKLGFVYGAVFALGAAYGLLEHQTQAIDWGTRSLPRIKEILPFSLLLLLALLVVGFFRAATSVLERLNGVSLAAHSTLHTNYSASIVKVSGRSLHLAFGSGLCGRQRWLSLV